LHIIEKNTRIFIEQNQPDFIPSFSLIFLYFSFIHSYFPKYSVFFCKYKGFSKQILAVFLSI